MQQNKIFAQTPQSMKCHLFPGIRHYGHDQLFESFEKTWSSVYNREVYQYLEVELKWEEYKSQIKNGGSPGEFVIQWSSLLRSNWSGLTSPSKYIVLEKRETVLLTPYRVKLPNAPEYDSSAAGRSATKAKSVKQKLSA